MTLVCLVVAAAWFVPIWVATAWNAAVWNAPVWNAPVWAVDERFLVDSWKLVALFGWQYGLLFGVASGCCWLPSAIGNPLLRVVVRILVVGLFALLLTWFVNLKWVTEALSLPGLHAVNLAGFLLAQTLAFALIGVPSWKWSGEKGHASGSSHVRFQIADLLALTTAFACLLGLTMRYESPIEAQSRYWTVLMITWLSAPIIAGSAALASLACSVRARLAWCVLGVLVIGCLGIGGGLSEKWSEPTPLVEILPHAMLYTLIFAAYGLTLFMFGQAGRLQGKTIAGRSDGARVEELATE